MYLYSKHKEDEANHVEGGEEEEEESTVSAAAQATDPPPPLLLSGRKDLFPFFPSLLFRVCACVSVAETESVVPRRLCRR